MGTSTSMGNSVKAELPKKARMFQEWPWVSCGIELVLKLHQKCLGVVKVVMGFHHMNQEAN